MDWEKIRAEYELSDISKAALAKKYGVPIGSIKYRARKYEWRKIKKDDNEKQTDVKSEDGLNFDNKHKAIIAVADKLLKCVDKATDELNIYIVKNKVKTKEVEFDSNSGKAGKEIVSENECVEEARGIIDRAELKQLVTALKDIKEIYDEQALGENKVEQLIRGLIDNNGEGVQ